MRGALSSSLPSKITASFRNGSIRLSGIEAMRVGADGRASARAARARSVPPPTALAHAQPRAAAGLVEEQHLAGVDQVRVADLVEVHAPQLGPAPRALQEQLEMSHSVSPRLTVYESGALGASSDSGTPACATCCAVPRCCGVIGKLGLRGQWRRRRRGEPPATAQRRGAAGRRRSDRVGSCRVSPAASRSARRAIRRSCARLAPGDVAVRRKSSHQFHRFCP